MYQKILSGTLTEHRKYVTVNYIALHADDLGERVGKYLLLYWSKKKTTGSKIMFAC